MTEMAETELSDDAFVSYWVGAVTVDGSMSGIAADAYPCGTRNGWFIRREGDKALRGAPERQPCAERTGFVHLMLDA